MPTTAVFSSSDIVGADGALAYSQKRARAMQRFFVRLGLRETSPCDIVYAGDSISEGYPPLGVGANLLTNQNWANLLANKLRATFPTTGAPGTRGYYTARRALPPSDWPVSFSGASTTDATGLALRGLHLNSASDTVTFTCPPGTTAVDIFWTRQSGTTSFNWRINAGSNTTVSTTGATVNGEFQSTRVTGVTAGDTVTCEYISGVGVYISGFFAYAGDETKGIRFWDSAKSSWNFGTGTTGLLKSEEWLNAFNVIQPALVIMQTVNISTIAGAQADIQNFISKVKAECTVAPSFLLVGNWQVGAPAEDWEDFIAMQKSVAAADDDVFFYDVRHDIYKPNMQVNKAGGLLPDDAHPGVAGSEIYAEAMFNVLRPGMAR